ncbi:VOC family protein [Adhaeribacter pallidiroseus]|uniref:Glyoxalase n=1 Tax=Adhaeribacter pallidiroseus TaxID=2072847 RepID=A0A369QB71_9BACT|nr:glyoxalase [Adhaeribacter pallidiroseus]RDC62173.1 hypothetical protein AHMF7616_00764 [Adhaeribacter pallidiroseus]
MEPKALSIRPFIGAKDFAVSRSFYRALGFEEVVLSSNRSLFKIDQMGFYLQDYYVEDWINNSMIFLEVTNVEDYWNKLVLLNLPATYRGVKIMPIQNHDWGQECFLHDPSGVLWHFGQFTSR